MVGKLRNHTCYYLRWESNKRLTEVYVAKGFIMIELVEGNRVLDFGIVVLYCSIEGIEYTIDTVKA